MTTLISAPIMMRLAEHHHHYTEVDIPEIALFVFCVIALVLMAGLVLRRD